MKCRGKRSVDMWQLNDEKSDHDDLEQEQSPVVKKRRSAIEGECATLTELAAPEPAPEIETGNDLEEEFREGELDPRESIAERNNQLTEVAVPEPVHHRPSAPEDSNEEEKAESGFQEDHKTSAFWIELVTISWLIFFSLLGTLARLGVEALTTYPSSPFPSTVLWANLGGSLFLGFLIEDRRLFRYTVPSNFLTDNKEETYCHIDRTKKTLPIYIGLATGFCGSFTSFSTFITDAFLALSNNLAPASPTSPYHDVPSTSLSSRSGGYSFLAVLGIIIIQSALSIGAFKTGAHVALGLERAMPSVPARFIHRALDPLAPFLGFGCWVGAIILTIFPPGPSWRFRATMSLVFSPPGTLLRFYLSKYFNARIPSFPLGTFAANMFGTCIEGMCYDLQHTNAVLGQGTSANANTCALLEGVISGFCGCTTTVSTWVAELNGLRRRHGWLYGLITVAVGLGFQVAIMGSVIWTQGFSGRCDA